MLPKNLVLNPLLINHLEEYPAARVGTGVPLSLGGAVFCVHRKERKSSSATRPFTQVMVQFGVVLSFLFQPLPFQGQTSASPEYRAKAYFLSKFPIFVEWPESALPPKHAPFLICVFGDFSFGTALAEKTRSTSIRERIVEIHWVRKEQELKSCQILFVSRSERKRYNHVLGTVSSQGVLTVGETAEFLDAGGIVSFTMLHELLQFDVNLDGANKVRLRISAQMLALARRVVHNPAGAKI